MLLSFSKSFSETVTVFYVIGRLKSVTIGLLLLRKLLLIKSRKKILFEVLLLSRGAPTFLLPHHRMVWITSPLLKFHLFRQISSKTKNSARELRSGLMVKTSPCACAVLRHFIRFGDDNITAVHAEEYVTIS